MYEIGRKPTRSEAFARVICHIAVKERGLSIDALSGSNIEDIADDALRRYPKICDARFRRMAIDRNSPFSRLLFYHNLVLEGGPNFPWQYRLFTSMLLFDNSFIIIESAAIQHFISNIYQN